MSAILKKRVCFWPRYSHFFEKGVYFLHIQQSPPKNSAFCRIRVPFEPSKVSVLENRGLFFHGKVSGKGLVFILENDHTSSFWVLSGGTGV